MKTCMKTGIRFAGGFGFAMMLAGCVSDDAARRHLPDRYEITIDALGTHPKAENYAYAFVPGNESVTAGDLQFREFADYVEIPLRAKGYLRASDEQAAAIGIRLSYNVSEPIPNEETQLVPVQGVVGVQSTQTVKTSETTETGGTTTSETVTEEPRYDVTGYREETTTFYTYRHTMVVEAFDLKAYRETGENVLHWQTTATCVSPSGDLRAAFPALVCSSWEYFGKSSRGIAKTSCPSRMSAIDRRFSAIRMRQPEPR